MKRKSERVQRTLRLPADLTAELERAAQENGRSLNAEITQRLLNSLHGWKR